MAGSPVGEQPHATCKACCFLPIRYDSWPQAEADAMDGTAEHRHSQMAINDHNERVEHELALVCVMKRVGTGPQKAGLDGQLAPRMAIEDCLQCKEPVRTHLLTEPPTNC